MLILAHWKTPPSHHYITGAESGFTANKPVYN